MAVKSKLNKTEEELVSILMSMGVDINKLASLAKVEEVKQIDEELGAFTIKDNGAIEVRRWSDKKGKVFIVQTRVLDTGVKTKGFGIPQEEFKAYVARLNSIADRL